MAGFLTANWVNLLNITFAVPPSLLVPHLPEGLRLDVRQQEAFASIVAFDFNDTKVKGIAIPGHINFPEINLRFYVKFREKRGVVFIKELVPKFCIAFVANRLYNEPYQSTAMTSITEQTENSLSITHKFNVKNREHHIRAVANKNSHYPSKDSLAYYFMEHDVGFGITKRGKTLCYRVKHPKWEIYGLEGYELDMDFGLIYGKAWDILKDLNPVSAILAKGSRVEVFNPQNLAIFERSLYLETKA